MIKKFTECPHCGTEILEAEDCSECCGSGCFWCNKTGKSNNYYCPHCNWYYEE